MCPKQVGEVLGKLALLEGGESDEVDDAEFREIEAELRALPRGALDRALGGPEPPEAGPRSPEPVWDVAGSPSLARDVGLSTHRRGTWENWSRNFLARDVAFVAPRSSAELVRAVQQVADRGGTVKAIGSFYSCSRASQPFARGTAIDSRTHLCRLLPLDSVRPSTDVSHLVRVEAGMRLDALARALADKGLALSNMGGFDKQTLAGMLSTGTHGTGLRHSTFADSVVSLDVVLVGADGRAQLHRFEPTNGITDPRSFAQAPEFLHQADEQFYAMVVACGMMGVVYSYTLRVVDLYFVRETNESFVYPDDLPGILERVRAGEDLSLTLCPYPTLSGGRHRGLVNRFERLHHTQVEPGVWEDPPRRPNKKNFLDFLESITGTQFIGGFMGLYPRFVRRQMDNYLEQMAGETFTSVYYEVYPRRTEDRFRALFNELAVPLGELPDAIARVLRHTHEHWKTKDLLYLVPFAVRFVGASHHLLSMHHGTDSGTVEAFALRGMPRGSTALGALEQLLIHARPHWGQLHGLASPPMVQYPSTWDAWLAQYRQCNPRGVFNSPMTDSLGISVRARNAPTDSALERLSADSIQLFSTVAEADDLEDEWGGIAETLTDEDIRADVLSALDQRSRTRQLAPKSNVTFENWLGEGDVPLAACIDDAINLDDLRTRLRSAENPVRVCGKRHSDNLVARPDPGSFVVDLSNWRLRKDADRMKDSPCQPVAAGDVVEVPYRKHVCAGERLVLMFAWETLEDIAQRGAKNPGGDPAERFALINSGSFTHQTLAGPLSVGTHGSGNRLGAMCDFVVAIDILGLDGIVRRVSDPSAGLPCDEIVLPGDRGKYTPVPSAVALHAAVVNLGTWGVVLAYWVKVRNYYWLTQEVATTTLTEALDWCEAEHNRPTPEWRHVELLVMPQRVAGEYRCNLLRRRECQEGSPRKGPTPWPKIVQAMRCNRDVTRDNAVFLSRSPLARQTMYQNALKYQERGHGDTGPWSQVLVRNTVVPAHGFEVAVPLFQARRALQCVLEGIEDAGGGVGKQRAKPTSPIGVRFVQAGDHYLAMNYREFEFAGKRFSSNHYCFIEVPRLWGTIAQGRIPEKIVERLKTRGVFFRIHWGQYAPPGSRDAAREYPALRQWLGARVTFGAGPRLLSQELCRALGLSAPPRFVSRTVGDASSDRASASPHLSLELEALQNTAVPVVLCIRGEAEVQAGQWCAEWSDALVNSLTQLGLPTPRLLFCSLDALFPEGKPQRELGPAALQFAHGWLRYQNTRSHAREALKDAGVTQARLTDRIAQWLDDLALQKAVRTRVTEAIRSHRPTVIVSHGLGSLFAYDTLTHPDYRAWRQSELAKDHPQPHFVALGGPIGHQSLRFVWGGRLVMPQAATFTHVYNPADPLFASSIHLHDARFREWSLPDLPGTELTQHCAVSYLDHLPTMMAVLRPLLRSDSPASTPFTVEAPVQPGFPSVLHHAATRAPKRALLVGINRYANPTFNLEGCVNDIYKVSALLQERFGYNPEHIRLLVDERATAQNIRERLSWLLEGASDGRERLFYFSGHGARVPGYNALEVIDQLDECLVPHDFSWHDPSTALLDDEFLDLYSQLPYDAHFSAILDCCHAGGMARGGGTNVRGLRPPDDIRHRTLAFSGATWHERGSIESKEQAIRCPGRGGFKRSFLGGARALRPPDQDFEDARKDRDHHGPYMPVLLYACAEDQLAFEHRVGTTTHGAFSYALTEYLAHETAHGLSFLTLAKHMAERLARLGYAQTPTLEGPTVRLDQFPFDP